MTDLGKSPNPMTIRDARRSTRISESVRLSVSGESKVGSRFSELTLTLAVNCHGCIYPSRNEHRTGSWVTLEFPNQQSDARLQPVRAQVRFVRAPQTPDEHYQIGVELEAPANVWRVTSIPKDWLRFLVFMSDTASSVRTTTSPGGLQVLDPTPISAEAIESKAQASTPAQAPVSPDHLIRLLEKKLQQAAERAVALAVASHLTPAVNQSITAIDKFSQASFRQFEEYCVRYQEKLVASAREEVLRRFQADLAHAEERLQTQLKASLIEFEKTVQNVTKGEVTEAHLVVAEYVDLLKNTARDLQAQFSTRSRETMDQAAAELSAETVRFSDRQLAFLAKQAKVAITEGSTLLETRAAETRSQLETAASTMLSGFHERASIEIDEAATQSRQAFMSSLTSFADEIRADLDARQRAWQDEATRSSEYQSEQFRQKLGAILHSSMISAISAVNEQSRTLLSSLSKEAEKDLIEVTQHSASS